MDALVVPLGTAEMRMWQRQATGRERLLSIALRCSGILLPEEANTDGSSEVILKLPVPDPWGYPHSRAGSLLCKHALRMWPVFLSKECGL